MKNVPLLLGTIIGSVLLIFGIGFLFSRTPAQSTTTVDRTLLENDLRHAKGASESAKVVIVEFSDFQCPACKATAPFVEQIVQANADTTKLVYRDFPLESIHPNSFAAAVAAEAASQQNAFWQYHDILFSNQAEWSEITNADALKAQFVAYAESLQLNKDQFIADLSNVEVAAKVTADASVANQLKVQSTPSFFVNGVPTLANDLQQQIDEIVAAQ
jgi:protein-disulfide isomerase